MHPECDRCIAKRPATVRVKCWMGCWHPQCLDCAKVTHEEAKKKNG